MSSARKMERGVFCQVLSGTSFSYPFDWLICFSVLSHFPWALLLNQEYRPVGRG